MISEVLNSSDDKSFERKKSRIEQDVAHSETGTSVEKERRFRKKRIGKVKCKLCTDKEFIQQVHFFNISFLSSFINEKAMITNSKYNGFCKKHQRLIRKTIIVARHLHLIDYISM